MSNVRCVRFVSFLSAVSTLSRPQIFMKRTEKHFDNLTCSHMFFGQDSWETSKDSNRSIGHHCQAAEVNSVLSIQTVKTVKASLSSQTMWNRIYFMYSIWAHIINISYHQITNRIFQFTWKEHETKWKYRHDWRGWHHWQDWQDYDRAFPFNTKSAGLPHQSSFHSLRTSQTFTKKRPTKTSYLFSYTVLKCQWYCMFILFIFEIKCFG